MALFHIITFVGIIFVTFNYLSFDQRMLLEGPSSMPAGAVSHA